MLYSNIVGPYEVERVRGKKKYALTTNLEYSKKKGKEIEYKFLGLNQVKPQFHLVEELRKLLKQEVRIKKAIVARAPELAIDAGLPVAQQATFKASLQVLASQLDAEPPNDTAADHTSRADSGTSTAVTTPLKKGVAVW